MNKNRITSLLLALFFTAVLSCSTLRLTPAQSADKALADSLWTYSLAYPEGFTLHLATWTQPQEGIVVAYEATQHCHDRKGLEFVITHAQFHEGYVGGWLELTDSLYYFDSVRVFPEDSLSAAISFGKENHQLAIFKLSTDEEIPL